LAKTRKAGHRRIATALFLKHRPLKQAYTAIEALLSINLDRHQGKNRSIREYARIFDRPRGWCAARVAEYDGHLDEIGNSATDQPEASHSAATFQPPRSPKEKRKPDRPDHFSATNRPLFSHQSATTLSLESESEKRRQDPKKDLGADAPPWVPLRNLRSKVKASELIFERFLRDNYGAMEAWRQECVAEGLDVPLWPSVVIRFWNQAQRKPWQPPTGEEIQEQAMVIVNRDRAAEKERNRAQ